MFEAIGKPRARVRVCLDPLLGGIGEALKWERIAEILERYRGMVQIFLLLVDRDGVKPRRVVLDNLEARAAEFLGEGRWLLAENAWQEIEVWALAGQELPTEWKWKQIRADLHPKEKYFDSHAQRRGLKDEPGEGRVTMGREAAANYARVRSRCREDVESLETRLRAAVGG